MQHKITPRRRLCEHLAVVLGIECRRGGKIAARSDVIIDLVGRDGYAVSVALTAHLHIQRDEFDVILLELLRAEIAGRVGSNLISHIGTTFFIGIMIA